MPRSSARGEGVAASRVLGILWEVGEVLETAALWSSMRRGHRDEAIEALGSQIYKEPGGDWMLADEYLSGNVVDKLAEAIDAARLDSSLERNVEALKKVQPDKLGPSQISVKLGAPWVAVQHVNEFAKEIEAGIRAREAQAKAVQAATAPMMPPPQ